MIIHYAQALRDLNIVALELTPNFVEITLANDLYLILLTIVLDRLGSDQELTRVVKETHIEHCRLHLVNSVHTGWDRYSLREVRFSTFKRLFYPDLLKKLLA